MHACMHAKAGTMLGDLHVPFSACMHGARLLHCTGHRPPATAAVPVRAWNSSASYLPARPPPDARRLCPALPPCTSCRLSVVLVSCSFGGVWLAWTELDASIVHEGESVSERRESSRARTCASLESAGARQLSPATACCCSVPLVDHAWRPPRTCMCLSDPTTIPSSLSFLLRSYSWPPFLSIYSTLFHRAIANLLI